jgi:hypothetical protein
MYNSCVIWADRFLNTTMPEPNEIVPSPQRTQRKRREEQRERKDQDPAFAAEGAEIADGKTGREVLCPL